MAKVLFAVSDKTRWSLLQKIYEGEICACELPSFVKVSQSAVSQHLKVLREAGLVQARRDGAKRIYFLSRLGKKVLNNVQGWKP